MDTFCAYDWSSKRRSGRASSDQTLLYQAAQEGHEVVVKLLLAQPGIRINTERGNSAQRYGPHESTAMRR
jgi:hypothetical protein